MDPFFIDESGINVKKVYILRDDDCMKFVCCRMPHCVLVTGFVLSLLVIALRRDM